MPIFALARAIPIVRTNSFILDFCCAKTCSTKARILERRPLARDVAEVLRQRLAHRLLPVGIHRDEAIGEALAVQQSVIEYDPHCRASLDFRQLAAAVARECP